MMVPTVNTPPTAHTGEVATSEQDTSTHSPSIYKSCSWQSAAQLQHSRELEWKVNFHWTLTLRLKSFQADFYSVTCGYNIKLSKQKPKALAFRRVHTSAIWQFASFQRKLRYSAICPYWGRASSVPSTEEQQYPNAHILRRPSHSSSSSPRPWHFEENHSFQDLEKEIHTTLNPGRAI